MRLPWPFGRSEAAPADPDHTRGGLPRPADARAAHRRVVVAAADPAGQRRAAGRRAGRVVPRRRSGGAAAAADRRPAGARRDAARAVRARRGADPRGRVADVERGTRRPAGPAPGRGGCCGRTGARAGPAVRVFRAASSAAASSAAEPSATIVEPLRQLSVVAPGAAADAPSRSLTRVEAWTPPAAGADRPLAHRTNVQTSSTAVAACVAGFVECLCADSGDGRAAGARPGRPPRAPAVRAWALRSRRHRRPRSSGPRTGSRRSPARSSAAAPPPGRPRPPPRPARTAHPRLPVPSSGRDRRGRRTSAAASRPPCRACPWSPARPRPRPRTTASTSRQASTHTTDPPVAREQPDRPPAR